CHEIKTAHLAAPDTACALCHLPLARAVRLTREDIAAFPKPPSHEQPGFARGAGHGAAAERLTPVTPSCGVCHARDFCLQCHVDAPEQPAIQALPPDPRATAIAVRLAPPPSHADESFLARHGGVVRRDAAACLTCHTRQSCLVCHGDNFAAAHRQRAAAAPATCAGCHVRADCLECHRADAARAAGYHPAGFLARHPAAAYAREATCSDCHNVGNFCTSCHARAGLRAAAGPLGSGYHDGTRFFIAGHG